MLRKHAGVYGECTGDNSTSGVGGAAYTVCILIDTVVHHRRCAFLCTGAGHAVSAGTAAADAAVPQRPNRCNIDAVTPPWSTVGEGQWCPAVAGDVGGLRQLLNVDDDRAGSSSSPPWQTVADGDAGGGLQSTGRRTAAAADRASATAAMRLSPAAR